MKNDDNLFAPSFLLILSVEKRSLVIIDFHPYVWPYHHLTVSLTLDLDSTVSTGGGNTCQVPSCQIGSISLVIRLSLDHPWSSLWEVWRNQSWDVTRKDVRTCLCNNSSQGRTAFLCLFHLIGLACGPTAPAGMPARMLLGPPNWAKLSTVSPMLELSVFLKRKPGRPKRNQQHLCRVG